MSRNEILNKAAEIIDLFLSVPETILDSLDRKSFYKIMHGFSSERTLTLKNISKIFNNLKKSGYIEIDNSNENESIRFTNKAKLLVVDKIAVKRLADNMYRFISFDVPERMRSNRDKFRRAIKRMGFRQIQKSLWVTQNNVGDLVEMAAIEYKINEYVVYIVSENTNIDDYIKKVLLVKSETQIKQ